MPTTLSNAPSNFMAIHPGSGGTNVTPFGLMGRGDAAGIPFPQRVGFQDVLGDIQKSLGPAQQVAPLQALQQVSALPGFGQDFFDEIFRRSEGRLQKQYFGKGGLQEKSTENLASRGLLGSSTEANTRGQLSDQFGSSLVDVQGDINRLRAEQQIELAKEQRQLQQKQDLQFQQLLSQRDLKNAEFESALQELGMRSALTEAKDRNIFGIGEFEQRVKLEDIAAQNKRERDRLELDLLSSPEVDLTQEQADDILDRIFGNGLQAQTSGGGGGGSNTTPFSAKGKVRGEVDQFGRPPPGRNYRLWKGRWVPA